MFIDKHVYKYDTFTTHVQSKVSVLIVAITPVYIFVTFCEFYNLSSFKNCQSFYPLHSIFHVYKYCWSTS